MHTAATWQIPLNRPYAAAMHPVVKLLWPLVNAYYAMKMTVGLASHWPFVTDCGISTYRFSGLRKGCEHPVYIPVGLWHVYLTLLLMCSCLKACVRDLVDIPSIDCDLCQIKCMRHSHMLGSGHFWILVYIS